MKALAIADRPPRNSIVEIAKNNNIELIITLGDLEHHQIRELEIITDIPKIGVYGNHCSGLYMPELGIKNMHLQTFEFGGLTFGGFEGSVRYKSSLTAKMYTQDEATELMQGFQHVDVMLAHCPPYGINDEPDDVAHMGFVALRKYIEAENPKYYLHGHTYPKEGELVTKYRETEILYIYEDQIIELS
jgi:uncharacterized protein